MGIQLNLDTPGGPLIDATFRDIELSSHLKRRSND